MSNLTIITGGVLVFLGIGLWGAGLVLPGGVFHNFMHMMVGMILLSLGGMVVGVPRNSNNGMGRRECAPNNDRT